MGSGHWMGHVQRVTIKFYSHIFSSDLNVLYLFKLPAPPRAVLLGSGAEYTGGIPFQHAGAYLAHLLHHVMDCVAWRVWEKAQEDGAKDHETVDARIHCSASNIRPFDRVSRRFHLSTIVFTKSWKTDFFSLVQVVPNLWQEEMSGKDPYKLVENPPESHGQPGVELKNWEKTNINLIKKRKLPKMEHFFAACRFTCGSKVWHRGDQERCVRRQWQQRCVFCESNEF